MQNYNAFKLELYGLFTLYGTLGPNLKCLLKVKDDLTRANPPPRGRRAGS